jgi:hypothetical protein
MAQRIKSGLQDFNFGHSSRRSASGAKKMPNMAPENLKKLKESIGYDPAWASRQLPGREIARGSH